MRVVWVEPALSADVELSERTHDRRVRAPVFKGFSRPSSAGDRLLFREDGIRRRELAGYYRAVAPVLLPHLRDRPFTIKRCYPLVQDEDALLWMLEYGCVDLHVWSSRCDRPERPDYVLFDLDPAGVGFADVVAAARLVREALEALELESCVRTSGGDGLHVLVPLARRHTHAEAREFAQVVAGALVRSSGGLVTAERSKERRRGVFLDTKMNGHGQQVVSSYSVRPLPGAPVATPLR